MDELELLKQDWQREKPNEFPHYSEKELFQMSKKNSVSIAKWVFIICILELIFWEGTYYILEYYFPSSGEDEIDIFDTIIDIINYINMPIPYIFLGILIYLYYKIKNTEDPKRLMKKIMWMKQAIHWYIKLFLIELIIVSILIILAGFSVIFNDNDIEFTAKYIVGLILFSFILFLIGFVCFGFIVVIKHIYYFIYGRFIKQLEENYQELIKIENQETSE